MRYTEQLKYSLIYHWGVSRDCLEMLTGKLHWWIVGLLFALCVVPCVVLIIAPSDVIYYATNSLPPFAPALLQDIIPNYYWAAREAPSFLLLFNYHWVSDQNFKPLALVLGLVSLGLLLVRHFREE